MRQVIDAEAKFEVVGEASDGETAPPPRNKPEVFTGELSFITEDGQGNMWFGVEAGLIRYAKGDSQLFTATDGLPSNVVTSYLFTRSGEIVLPELLENTVQALHLVFIFTV